jgi:hypothetical protein
MYSWRRSAGPQVITLGPSMFEVDPQRSTLGAGAGQAEDDARAVFHDDAQTLPGADTLPSIGSL